jgi:hypothetical protein
MAMDSDEITGTGDDGAKEAPSTSSFCGQCGGAVAGVRFCPSCGAAVAGGHHSGDIEVGRVEPGGTVLVSRRAVVVVTLLVLALVVGALGAWKILATATRTTHTITGTMALFDVDEFLHDTKGDACSGSGGYSDVDFGADVRVRNQNGDLIASSHLEQGHANGLATCVFKFTVKNVRDAGFYSIEVSRRGELSYSKDDMAKNDWKVSATLGH